MRLLVVTLLLLAAHFSLTPFAPTPAGQAWLFWPFAADSRPLLAAAGGLPQQSGSFLTPLLAGVAGLGFLAAPALVVSAIDNPLAIHRNTTTLAERIPGAEQLVLESGGHPMLGQGARVRAAVSEFLRRHHATAVEAEIAMLANANV